MASGSFVSSEARQECAGRDAYCSDTSLTFFPQQGASGFFADHIGDGAEVGNVLWWSGLGRRQQSARTMAGVWCLLGRWGYLNQMEGLKMDDSGDDAFGTRLGSRANCSRAAVFLLLGDNSALATLELRARDVET